MKEKNEGDSPQREANGSLVDALLSRADTDYCAARLMAFGFGLTYQAGFLFQQAVEKYLKGLVGVELEENGSDDVQIEKEWQELGHKTERIWEKVKKKYDGPKKGQKVIQGLLKYLDSGELAVTSRYPGGQGFGYHENLPFAVDYFVFVVRQDLMGRKDSPIREPLRHSFMVERYGNIFRSRKLILKKCFLTKNQEYLLLSKRKASGFSTGWIIKGAVSESNPRRY